MQEYAMVLIAVSRIIFLVTNILLLNTFLTPKRSWWFQTIVFAVTWAAASWLDGVLQSVITDDFLHYYIVGLLYIVPCVLIFKESFHAEIFVFFMIYSLSQFALVIFMFLEHLIFNHLVGILILPGLLLELVSLPLIRKYIKPHVTNIIEMIDQQNSVFTLFPIISSLVLAFFDVKRTNSLATFMSLLLCTLLIVSTYYLIARSIDQTKRHQQLEKQLALQRDHYQNLYESIESTKALRHDLRHHLVTIVEFLGKNNTCATLEYLNRLSSSYDDSSLPIVCSNQAADALICHYLKLAKQLNVTTITELHLPDNLGIDDLDLCVILGNCLENAIEACSKMRGNEPRRIDIKSKISKGYLLITITNSFDGFVLHQGGEGFLSTKKGTNHGIGLSNVKAVADKYSGHLASSFDQRVFKVSVSLKLPKSCQHKMTG